MQAPLGFRCSSLALFNCGNFDGLLANLSSRMTKSADDKWYTRECRLLDPIREHPRYLACVERVEKLLEPC